VSIINRPNKILTKRKKFVKRKKGYLEYKTKTYNHISSLIVKSLNRLSEYKPCPDSKGIFVGKCQDCGAVFLASLDCKKEICEVCGQVGSSLHRRRMSRWAGKVLWMYKKYGYISYMIITFPQEIRDKFYDRENLKKFRRYVVRKVKRMGFECGKVRYHWTGDLTGERGEFYPHLNFLGAGRSFLSKDEIEKLKEDITKWFYDEFKIKTKKVVLYYQVIKNVMGVWHKVRYITRPTLLLIENEERRNEVWEKIVKGFTNDISFGKIGKLKRDEITENILNKILIGLEKENVDVKGMMATCLFFNRCPVCGGNDIKWEWRNYNFTSDGGLEGDIWFEDENGKMELRNFYLDKSKIHYLGLGFYIINGEPEWVV